MKLQKKPHVLDVQGIRRIAHLYGSTAMFASQAKSNAHHWGNFTKNHKTALDQAHDIIEKEGYTHSRTRNAAKTVYAPATELEAQGFQPDIGGPISDQKAFDLLQAHPQPFHSKQLPLRLDLNWDISDTLYETDDEPHTTPQSRAQELFTTPHRADKMAPPRTPRKRACPGVDQEGGDFEEAIARPDDVVAVHTVTTFAKEACIAEEKITWMHETYPGEQFLKTFVEAVKVLPDSIKIVEEIIERYNNRLVARSPGGSFLDKVRNTLPRAAPDNRDVFEVPRPTNTESPNPFNRHNPFQGSPSTQGQSAYAIRPQDRLTITQAPGNASFYKDVTKDLAKLAPPNPIERYGETKDITVEGKGKISLVGLTSRTDS
jgi:hypothetical protein